MNSFYKGILTGFVAGATLSMLSNPLDHKKVRVAKRRVGKAMRTVGHVINEMGFMD